MSAKLVLAMVLVMLGGCAHSGAAPDKSATAKRWWPFDNTSASKIAANPTLAAPKYDQKWLDDYEPRLREALQGSGFDLERREDVLLVTMPVEGSFNPDRPQLLLPAKLGPLTRMAKLAEQDPQGAAVLILGHADSSGKLELNRRISEQRAQAVGGIFRLSGFERDRMRLKGVGSDMPRAANDSPEGRALNRRVEILLAPKANLVALLQQYLRPPTPAKLASSKP
ncbi:OmpA family protein [Pseudomonas sp.]|uniref:OmpA family protein n=1 Tax=Pseudomonas sp. TaxID=306 RepID=UPI003BB63A5B